MKIETADNLIALGAKFGSVLRGGEVIELIGDVGAGKTTFVKGLAKGLKIDEDVQSPSFTISRNYPARDDLTLNHYDFYRLSDAGIMNMEIAETFNNPHSITVVEWGESVHDVLPDERIVVEIAYLPKTGREIQFKIPEKFTEIQKILTA